MYDFSSQGISDGPRQCTLQLHGAHQFPAHLRYRFGTFRKKWRPRRGHLRYRFFCIINQFCLNEKNFCLSDDAIIILRIILVSRFRQKLKTLEYIRVATRIYRDT